MKKLVLLFTVVLLSGLSCYAMYDFCESPSDYYTFPQAYDVRTEYWKDIPDYHPNNDNIKFEDMKNEHPTFPIKFKKKQKPKQEKSE